MGVKKKYVCTRYLISTFPDIWSSYSISFCIPRFIWKQVLPWLKEHSLYHLIHMNYNLSSPKWQIQRSVMWLCQMRVVRKAERSTCLELDECQNPFCFSLKNRYMSEESRWPQCNCRSLSMKQDFLFTSFQHSSCFPLNLSYFIPPETHRNFLLRDRDVSGVCILESAWPHQHWAGQSRPATGAESPVGPKSGSRSGTVQHHAGSRAVTHPLSVVWDGAEVGVNCRSAVKKLALLSVSENEG